MSRKQKRTSDKGRGVQLELERAGRWWVRPAIIAFVLVTLLALAGFLARPAEAPAQGATGAKVGEAHSFYGST